MGCLFFSLSLGMVPADRFFALDIARSRRNRPIRHQRAPIESELLLGAERENMATYGVHVCTCTIINMRLLIAHILIA